MTITHIGYARASLTGHQQIRVRLVVTPEELESLNSWCTMHGGRIEHNVRAIQMPTHHFIWVWLGTVEQQVAFKLRWWDGSIRWPQEPT